MFTSEVRALKDGDKKSQLCRRRRGEKAAYITVLPASGADLHCSLAIYCHMQSFRIEFFSPVDII